VPVVKQLKYSRKTKLTHNYAIKDMSNSYPHQIIKVVYN